MVERWNAVLAGLAALIAVSPAQAEWQQATSRHFIVYADGSPDAVRRQAEELERFDSVIAAVIVFVLRPSGEPELPAAPAATRQVVPNAPIGKLVCVFQPDSSRVTVSATPDVALDWGRSGCGNGRTQFVPAGNRWERVLVPDDEQTVSVLTFDPATRGYADTRYMLGAQAMAQVRMLRGEATDERCSVNPDVIDRLARRAAAVRAALPPLPNEKLAYSCRKTG